MKKISIYLLITLFVSQQAFSQNRTFFNQYMINAGTFNPAWTNIFTETGAFLNYRKQYIKQANSPESIYANVFHHIDRNHSIGGSVLNDRFSNFNQLEASANYVYHVWFQEKVALGFGIKAAYTQRAFNQNNYSYFDPLEPTLDNELINRGFNFGVGISLSSKNFDFNAALPYIFANYAPNASRNYRIGKLHGYSSIGYKFRISEDFIFHPTAYTKMVFGSPISAAADLNFLVNRFWWFGAGYRTNNSASVTAGVFLKNGLRVIYSFETASFTGFKTSGSSHELNLVYAKPFGEKSFQKRKYSRKKRSGNFKGTNY